MRAPYAVAVVEVVTARTDELSDQGLLEVTMLLEAAFGHSFEEYWHEIGPAVHFVLESDDAVVAHACVVERALRTQDRELRTGYVEGVATRPDLRRRGHGTAVMEAVDRFILDNFDLGGLDTGSNTFYARLGWETWRGPTFIRCRDGSLMRTADEDGNVMILRTATTRCLDVTAPLSAEWRRGDLW
jgi:aminoglycoside 2'-N-acetyltransferase I